MPQASRAGKTEGKPEREGAAMPGPKTKNLIAWVVMFAAIIIALFILEERPVYRGGNLYWCIQTLTACFQALLGGSMVLYFATWHWKTSWIHRVSRLTFFTTGGIQLAFIWYYLGAILLYRP